MGQDLQVLIVEDRPEDAELVVRHLESHGFTLDWQRVDSEEEFRHRLVATLDIVLADFTVPGFGAMPAMDILKEEGLDIPVIVVSGTVGDEQAAACIRHGATDYVLKDRLARLGPAIDHAIHARRLRWEHAKAQGELRQREKQLRSILAGLGDVVLSVSLPDWSTQYVNPAAERLFQRPVADFYKDANVWQQCVHPEDREVSAQGGQDTLRWGVASYECRILRPDQSVRNVAIRSWVTFGPNRIPIRLEAIVTDVTDRVHAEEERLARQEAQRESLRLAQLNEFRTTFVNMVAHDLNNIVTPMELSLHALRTAVDRGQLAEHAIAISRLEHGLKRQLEFLGDMLETARLQSGKLFIVPKPFDLSGSLALAVDAAKAQAEQRGIKVEADIPSSIAIEADERRIEQVTSNLLSNALKFTPPGETITVSLVEHNSGVQLTVADTGPGLTREGIEKLFQPFSRVGTVPQGKHSGTGLGLFICRGIVEQHGGRIWCESAGPGTGSAFHVTLPAKPQGAFTEFRPKQIEARPFRPGPSGV